MKKICIFMFFFCFGLALLAQKPEEKKYLLTAQTNTVGLSALSILDSYLSPITYNGLGVSVSSDSRRFLSVENTNISILSTTNLQAGILLNPRFTSEMLCMDLNYGWGMQYHFKPIYGFNILVGGLWDIDLGVKEVARNVNNPANMDLYTNLNVCGLILYNLPLKYRTLKCKLAMQTPVLGCMFVPLAGASYYEMFELGVLSNTFHLSSLHNKRGINTALTVDVPFNRSVWSFGLKYNGIKYSANELIFKRNEISLLVGTTFDFIHFAGRKNPIPRNFISTNE